MESTVLKKVKELNYHLPVILSSGSLSFADDLDLKELGVKQSAYKAL
jgi:hypothetical protein